MKNWKKTLGILAAVGGISTAAGAAHAYGYAAHAWPNTTNPAYAPWGASFSGTVASNGNSVNYLMGAGFTMFGWATWINIAGVPAPIGQFSTVSILGCSDGSFPTQRHDNVTTAAAGNTLVVCPFGTTAGSAADYVFTP